MGKYTPEEKAASLRRSRELLEELDNMQPYEPAAEDVDNADTLRANMAYVPAPEDALTRWKREALETEARREKARADRKRHEEAILTEKMQADAGWNAWLTTGIEAALKTAGHELHDTLVGLVVELRKERRAEIEAAVAGLRAEFAKQRGIADGDIIEMQPSPDSSVRKVKINGA